MPKKKNRTRLQDVDVYSLILFALYKIREVPEFSAISELAYTLDKKNLLRLCEYFGGRTIKIPTLEDIEDMTYALLLYQMVDIEHKDLDASIEELGYKPIDLRLLKSNYYAMKSVLSNYEISERGKEN